MSKMTGNVPKLYKKNGSVISKNDDELLFTEIALKSNVVMRNKLDPNWKNINSKWV